MLGKQDSQVSITWGKYFSIAQASFTTGNGASQCEGYGRSAETQGDFVKSHQCGTNNLMCNCSFCILTAPLFPKQPPLPVFLEPPALSSRQPQLPGPLRNNQPPCDNTSFIPISTQMRIGHMWKNRNQPQTPRKQISFKIRVDVVEEESAVKSQLTCGDPAGLSRHEMFRSDLPPPSSA